MWFVRHFLLYGQMFLFRQLHLLFFCWFVLWFLLFFVLLFWFMLLFFHVIHATVIDFYCILVCFTWGIVFQIFWWNFCYFRLYCIIEGWVGTDYVCFSFVFHLYILICSDKRYLIMLFHIPLFSLPIYTLLEFGNIILFMEMWIRLDTVGERLEYLLISFE